jgi:hypothetical protein
MRRDSRLFLLVTSSLSLGVPVAAPPRERTRACGRHEAAPCSSLQPRSSGGERAFLVRQVGLELGQPLFSRSFLLAFTTSVTTSFTYHLHLVGQERGGDAALPCRQKWA